MYVNANKTLLTKDGIGSILEEPHFCWIKLIKIFSRHYTAVNLH